MPSEFCPTCGKSLSQESKHPCRCGDVVRKNPASGINGKRFVGTLALVAGLVALIAYGLYHAIAIMRVQHGLSGFH